jgi:hypothetical protein
MRSGGISIAPATAHLRRFAVIAAVGALTLAATVAPARIHSVGRHLACLEV